MKRYIKFAAFLCVLAIFWGNADVAGAAKKKSTKKAAPAPAASVKVISVNAEGVAPVIDGRKNEAREAAKRELMRNAVDAAIGSYVESVTKINNYQAVSDKVFSQAKGMVKRMDIDKEWVDENGMLHVTAKCEVSESNLDSVLGPAVIDALGNPRVMIMLEEGTARSQVQKIFEKAGYMIINQTQAQILKKIDLEAAYAANDYSKIRDVAKNFHADVLITGKANAVTVNTQSVYGQKLYAVSSTVQLEAVLSDTAQTIGSEEFSWRPASRKECSLSHSEGAAKGLSICSSRAATSVVNKIAYALTAGTAGGVPGKTVKIIIKNIDYKAVRTLEEDLSALQGVNGVYRRRFVNGNEIEIDVVSDKTADNIADFLSDRNFNITEVSATLVEGSK